jgi:hypothetical protein
MLVKTEEAKARAEALFRRREQQSRDAEQVAVENSEKSRAVDEKTERLKGLRLAKEAADRMLLRRSRPRQSRRVTVPSRSRT